MRVLPLQPGRPCPWFDPTSRSHTVDRVFRICIIRIIDGLVTRCSSESTQSRTLIEGAGFVKAMYTWISTVFMRQPSLKLVSFNKGFLLFAATRHKSLSGKISYRGSRKRVAVIRHGIGSPKGFRKRSPQGAESLQFWLALYPGQKHPRPGA